MDYERGPAPRLLEDALDPLGEYLKAEEPGRAEKASLWRAAIGLQDVDHLRTSDYLLQKAQENIEGTISLEETKKLIDSYYRENADHLPKETEEADKVSARIAEILSEKGFTFSPVQYISIHSRLFDGIYKHAGTIRDYNITKKEWVLDGDTVTYGSATELRATLEYDFKTEREFSYAGLNMSGIIQHIARFISRLWQIHVFGEGNTRTAAVFMIKYLRYLGFNANNEIFAQNAWYFRNALVRANYTAIGYGIREDTRYLERFLRNLLMGEHHPLKNRELHIRWEETSHSTEKQHIEQHIGQHIDEKAGFADKLKSTAFTSKTKANIQIIYSAVGAEKIFSRRDITDILGITERPAASLLTKMKSFGLIEPVCGLGKGKYRFVI